MRLLLEVLDGLDHLHKHNWLHRDLAARNRVSDSLTFFQGNVFLDGGMHAVLGDYGHARQLNYLGQSSQPQPVYFEASEIKSEARYTVATDMYSFGCLVWEILTDCLEH